MRVWRDRPTIWLYEEDVEALHYPARIYNIRIGFFSVWIRGWWWNVARGICWKRISSWTKNSGGWEMGRKKQRFIHIATSGGPCSRDRNGWYNREQHATTNHSSGNDRKVSPKCDHLSKPPRQTNHTWTIYFFIIKIVWCVCCIRPICKFIRFANRTFNLQTSAPKPVWIQKTSRMNLKMI